MNLVNPYRFGKFEFPEDLVSGFIHGWSTARKLRSAYGGDAIFIQNSNTPQPTLGVGFVNNIVDIGSIQAQGWIGTINLNIKYDQIGSRNFTASGSTRPTINPVALVSGRLYAGYDGSNDYLVTGSATPITDDDCTVFVVFESQASTDAKGVFAEQVAATSANRVAVYSDTTASNFFAFNYAPAGTPNLINFPSQQPTSTKRCLILRKTGTTVEGYDESGTLINSITSASTFSVDTVLELGRQLIGSLYFGGKIAELLINNTALSTADRNLVLDNIKDFYSIT